MFAFSLSDLGQQTKGTQSFGRRHNKVHTLCVRCGKSSYHIQRARCASCGYPARRTRSCESDRVVPHPRALSLSLSLSLSPSHLLPNLLVRCRGTPHRPRTRLAKGSAALGSSIEQCCGSLTPRVSALEGSEAHRLALCPAETAHGRPWLKKLYPRECPWPVGGIPFERCERERGGEVRAPARYGSVGSGELGR